MQAGTKRAQRMRSAFYDALNILEVLSLNEMFSRGRGAKNAGPELAIITACDERITDADAEIMLCTTN